jgi:beta-mannanase
VSGKQVSIVHFWSFWGRGGQYQPFSPDLLETVRRHGSIPMVTWAPEDMNGGVEQPDYRLIEIIKGRHDDYIRGWAAGAKAWRHPFFLRWAHEPDGSWFPWGEEGNGNGRGQYVHAWRHVHDLFREMGATNVTWVWCPNVQFPKSPRPSYASLYPGDAYVDWTCLDGYNWGSNHPAYGGWDSFDEVFRFSYDAMLKVAPDKPMMLGEWASTETGGSKAAWINDALSVQLPLNYPKIKAAVWYNYLRSEMDWRVESSAAASSSWRSAMSSHSWRAAEYGSLERSPIPPP